ncbi:MAG: WD40 repeat domain-containing protein [Pirellulales bacterium]
MSRMTRAEFLRQCALGGICTLGGWSALVAPTFVAAPLRAEALNAVPRLAAQRLIEHKAELPTDRAPVVTGVAISPDGKLLASAGDDHIVRMWRMSDGELLHRFREHTDWVRAVSFSPDGARLVTAGDDRSLRIWDVRQGTLLKALPEQPLGIRAARFSPQGQTVVAAGFDQMVRIYDVREAKQIRTAEAPCPDMRAVGFSLDGMRVAAGGRDGRLRLFNVNDDQDTPAVGAHSQRMRAIAFSPDGQSLVTAGEDSNVVVWDPIALKPRAKFLVRGSKIMSVAWCGPRTVAAGGTDNLVHLFDVVTQQEIAVLGGHTGTIAALDSDLAGRVLVSGSFDTTARIWNIEAVTTGATTARNDAPPTDIPTARTSARPSVAPTTPAAPGTYK